VLQSVTDARSNVLLLASGDVRSPLYSLVRDSLRRRPVAFLVNDVDPHVVARNAVILWLAHHAPAAHVFGVWFSLLTGTAADEELSAIGLNFWRPEDRTHVYRVLRDWGEMRLEWSNVQATRWDVLRQHWKLESRDEMRAAARAKAKFELLPQTMADSSVPLDAYAEELCAYYETGSITPLGEEGLSPPELANPTLFRSATAYDLHYGSNPFLAFPLYAREYDARRPIATLCLRELESWVTELKARQGDGTWTLAVGDCLHVCAALVPRQFEVVATSNVADHVGLLPLLQAARMITRPGGTLITSTLLHLTYSDHIGGYLKANLLLEPELWPGVLGLRCVGREGTLGPRSSQVELEMPSLRRIFSRTQRANAEDGTPKGKVRAEENLFRTPAEASNLPLQIDGAVTELVRMCRLAPSQMLSGSPFVPAAATGDGVNQLHLHTLLPILCSAENAEQHLQPEDHELRDALAFWRGKLPLVIATLPLTDAALHSTKEPQPHLAVLLETLEHGTLVYSGLWIRYDNGARLVSWLVDPLKLAGATARLVGEYPSTPILSEGSGLVGAPCAGPSAAVVDWLRCRSPPGWPALARAEAKDGTRVAMHLTDEWWARVQVYCDTSGFIYTYLYIFIHPSIHICLSIYLSVCLFVCLSICPSI